MMYTADQVIALLQRAPTQPGQPRVRAAYDALMNQLAACLVGEPLADGVVSDTEWVLLGYSLRQFSRSPRSAVAWALIQKQTQELDAAIQESEQAQAAAAAVPEPVQTPAPSRRGMRPAWLSALARNRAVQPVTTIHQEVGVIRDSQNVILIGQNNQPGVPEVDESLDDDSTPPGPPTTPTTCDIFLSYSRRDARLMRRLRADLTAEGFDVWTDENLKPGTPSWLKAVEEAIASAMCMIVLLSPDAKKSEWVEKELSTAKMYRKQIIPLLTRGDEKSAVPLILSNTQYADIRSDSDYKRRIRDLARVLRNLQRGAQAARV